MGAGLRTLRDANTSSRHYHPMNTHMYDGMSAQQIANSLRKLDKSRAVVLDENGNVAYVFDGTYDDRLHTPGVTIHPDALKVKNGTIIYSHIGSTEQSSDYGGAASLSSMKYFTDSDWSKMMVVGHEGDYSYSKGKNYNEREVKKYLKSLTKFKQRKTIDARIGDGKLYSSYQHMYHTGEIRGKEAGLSGKALTDFARTYMVDGFSKWWTGKLSDKSRGVNTSFRKAK